MFTSSKKESKEMQQQIIESAGKIYNYLSSRGEVTINKLRKDMDLDDNFTYMGLGYQEKIKLLILKNQNLLQFN